MSIPINIDDNDTDLPTPKPVFCLVADLSHNNDLSSLDILTELNVHALIHKATQGILYVDPKYTRRRQQSLDAGLLFGSYHFGTNAPGVIQAKHYLNNSGPDIHVLDFEDNGKQTMSVRDAESFVTYVNYATGRPVGLYSNESFLIDLFAKLTPDSPLFDCWLWVAKYSLSPPTKRLGQYLWQFTDNYLGHEIDMSRFDGDVEQLKAFWTRYQGSVPTA